MWSESCSLASYSINLFHQYEVVVLNDSKIKRGITTIFSIALYSLLCEGNLTDVSLLCRVGGSENRLRQEKFRYGELHWNAKLWIEKV